MLGLLIVIIFLFLFQHADYVIILPSCPFVDCVTWMFTGEGMSELSLADRATIANMSPEYGATMGFFPVDYVTLQYLKLTGRSDDNVIFYYLLCLLL